MCGLSLLECCSKLYGNLRTQAKSLRRLCVRRATQKFPLPFCEVSKNLYLGQEASNCMATTWAYIGSNSFTIAVFC